MSNNYLNRCWFNTTSSGTGSIVAGTAYDNSYFTPSQAGAVASRQYTWALMQGTDVQIFVGTYGTAGGGTITRDTTLISKISGSVGTANITLTGAGATVECVSAAEDQVGWEGSVYSLVFPDATKMGSAVSLGPRNILIDPGFTINQRGYVSAATLTAGSYGHDRWKAGASGGDYSFTQLVSSTQITIAANKSIIQVVENVNVIGGSYILSWTGNATARIGLNSATPSGNFAVSPILITGQAAGTTTSVEFTGANAVGGSSLATNTGTLLTPQYELGAIATPFDWRQYGTELALCQRYYQKSYPMATAPGTAGGSGSGAVYATPGGSYSNGVIEFKASMRGVPTLVIYDNAGTAAKKSYYAGGWFNNGQTVNVGGAGLGGIGWFSAIDASSVIANFDYTLSAEL